jgi:uncharacterized protein (TIGR00730 family)
MAKKKAIKRICVNCGSSPGSDPAFMGAARDLGQCLAERNMTVVYGGADVGLMGALANTALTRGGQVIGVIPEAIADKVGHRNLSEQHVVTSMHERKQMMFDLSDAFVVLPGGYGTIEEMFEILTWAQLGMHAKPVGLLNVAGYFDSLLRFLDHSVAKRFVKQPHRDRILVHDSTVALLDRLTHDQAVVLDKWIDREEGL